MAHSTMDMRHKALSPQLALQRNREEEVRHDQATLVYLHKSPCSRQCTPDQHDGAKLFWYFWVGTPVADSAPLTSTVGLSYSGVSGLETLCPTAHP